MAVTTVRGRFSWSWRALWTPAGRIPRLPYFLNGLVYSVAYALLVMVGPSYVFGGSRLYYIAAFPVVLALLVLMYCLYSKRFHDFSAPGWLGVALLAPAVLGQFITLAYLFLPSLVDQQLLELWDKGSVTLTNILRLVGLVLLFVPGSRGPNIYGPDPRTPQTPQAEVF